MNFSSFREEGVREGGGALERGGSRRRRQWERGGPEGGDLSEARSLILYSAKRSHDAGGLNHCSESNLMANE